MIRKKRYIVTVRKYIRKIASFLLTKDVAVFLLFLAVAFFFWLMHGTGSRREIKIEIPLEYTSIPSDIKLDSELPRSLTFVLKDEGKELWGYMRKKNIEPVKIDLSADFDGSGVLEKPVDELLSRISPRFAGSTQIVSVTPSVIQAQYTRLQSKRVPFTLATKPPLAPQHILLDSILLSAHEATVYGDMAALDTITEIRLVFPDGQLSKTSDIKLSPSDIYKGIAITPSTVDAHIGVEMSTEKSVTVRITAVNFPKNVSLRAFPGEAKVTFTVGLSRFNQVTAHDFAVEVDYNSLKEKGFNGRTKLRVTRRPDYVQKVRVSPAEIEYIFEEEL